MTQNIDIKIEAQEAGATAAFKRLRSEVINNEKALAGVSRQGKLTGKSLKEIASLGGLGQLGGIGDALEKASDAAGGLGKASLLAKAGLVGLAATAGFSIGKTIGNWVFQTERWKKELEEAHAAMRAADRDMMSMMGKRMQGEVSTIAGLPSVQQAKEQAAAVERITKELASGDERLLANRKALKDRDWWIIQTGNWTGNTASIKEEVDALEGRRKVLMDNLKALNQIDVAKVKAAEREKALQAAMDERHRRFADFQKQQAAEAAAQAKAAEAQQRQEQSLLDGLNAQIIALEQGEEAAMRYRLELQGIGQSAIESAIAMQRQIDEMRDAAMQSAKPESMRSGNPGQLQAQQQRFITRGSGMSLEKQVADNTKTTAKAVTDMQATQAKMAAEWRKHFNFIERQLSDPA